MFEEKSLKLIYSYMNCILVILKKVNVKGFYTYFALGQYTHQPAALEGKTVFKKKTTQQF